MQQGPEPLVERGVADDHRLDGSVVLALHPTCRLVDAGAGQVGRGGASPVQPRPQFPLLDPGQAAHLSQPDFSGSDPLRASVGFGAIEGVVPEALNVEVSGELAAGEVEVFGGDLNAGPGAGGPEFRTFSAGVQGAGRLLLELEGGLGQITVARSDA